MAKRPDGFNNAWYMGVPVYFNKETNAICGRNGFYDLLIAPMIWMDINVFRTTTFKILIEEDHDR